MCSILKCINKIKNILTKFYIIGHKIFLIFHSFECTVNRHTHSGIHRPSSIPLLTPSSGLILFISLIWDYAAFHYRNLMSSHSIMTSIIPKVVISEHKLCPFYLPQERWNQLLIIFLWFLLAGTTPSFSSGFSFLISPSVADAVSVGPCPV